jgi:hypothetical protein
MRANAARDKPASWESSSSVHARQGALCMRPRVRAVCGERTVENQSFAAGEMASAQFAHEVNEQGREKVTHHDLVAKVWGLRSTTRQAQRVAQR